MISFMIPTILEIFPDAVIIHIYRYAPSVVESYVKRTLASIHDSTIPRRNTGCTARRTGMTPFLEIHKQRQALSLAATGQYLEFSYEDLCRRPNLVLRDLALLVGVDASGFGFDLSTISSQNYKVGDYATILSAPH